MQDEKCHFLKFSNMLKSLPTQLFVGRLFDIIILLSNDRHQYIETEPAAVNLDGCAACSGSRFCHKSV